MTLTLETIAKLRAMGTPRNITPDAWTALLDAAEAGLRAGWQPIETAPKDGTPFDIWWESTLDRTAGRAVDCSFHDGVLMGPARGTSSFYRATHFRFIPEPPA